MVGSFRLQMLIVWRRRFACCLAMLRSDGLWAKRLLIPLERGFIRKSRLGDLKAFTNRCWAGITRLLGKLRDRDESRGSSPIIREDMITDSMPSITDRLVSKQ